eukprot:c20696_g1_i2.p1 GENE.c20696_g1_i2~~c20696_g1_i2.p1  ORF type:complete len:340 (-),score=89.36 c20696_g1_i2:24-1043(-)
MLLILLSIILITFYASKSNWVISAKKLPNGVYSETQIDEVASVVRLLPIFGFAIMYLAIYSQMSTNFVIQGCQMDIRLFDGEYQLNATSLSAFDSLAIILLVPFFDKILFPFYFRFFGKNPTILQKIGAGFVVSILSMIVAGFVEIQRKNSPFIDYNLTTMPLSDKEIRDYDSRFCNPQNITDLTLPIYCSNDMIKLGCHCQNIENHSYLTGCTNQPMMNYSIWIQSIQFILIGISEILAMTAAYELFYHQVPPKLRSASQVLNILTPCFGSIVAGGLNTIFRFWIKNNINDGKLEFMYFMIAIIMTLNTFFFIIVSQKFKYLPLNDDTVVKEISLIVT